MEKEYLLDALDARAGVARSDCAEGEQRERVELLIDGGGSVGVEQYIVACGRKREHHITRLMVDLVLKMHWEVWYGMVLSWWIPRSERAVEHDTTSGFRVGR